MYKAEHFKEFINVQDIFNTDTLLKGKCKYFNIQMSELQSYLPICHQFGFFLLVYLLINISSTEITEILKEKQKPTAAVKLSTERQ